MQQTPCMPGWLATSAMRGLGIRVLHRWLIIAGIWLASHAAVGDASVPVLDNGDPVREPVPVRPAFDTGGSGGAESAPATWSSLIERRIPIADAMETASGATMASPVQRLIAQVDHHGLTVQSVDPGDGVRVRVLGLGRGGILPSLPATGAVGVSRDRRWMHIDRGGLREEITATADGIRQDFVIDRAPDGDGEVRLALALHGAEGVDAAADGSSVSFRFASGRAMRWTGLHTTDAAGRILASRFRGSGSELAIEVDDADAVYPVRIDPTFTDADWTAMGTISANDFNGQVNAIVAYGTGFVVGGQFTTMGSTTVNRVAYWNGTTWSGLGGGVGGGTGTVEVKALAVSGSDLYVGGLFTTAGGSLTVNSVAKWDGSAWSALANGATVGISGALQTVYALSVGDGYLYAGGSFATSGGVTATNVSRWNLATPAWSSLTSGGQQGVASAGVVRALAHDGSRLFVGGDFTAGIGQSAYLTAWTDAGGWATVGTGMGANVHALSVSGAVGSGGALFAGGTFTTAGGVSANRIARWNGSAWTALGTGVASGTVMSLYADAATTCYAGGSFTSIGGVSVERIGRWNGSAWSTLGTAGANGCNLNPNAIASALGQVLVGGTFTAVATSTVGQSYLASWNGTSWGGIDTASRTGVDRPEVRDAVVVGGNLYVAGDFTSIAGVSRLRTAMWNGSSWSSLGSGVSGSVRNLLVVGTDIYACGAFASAGGVANTSRIAKYDTLTGTWSAVGRGLSGGAFTASVLCSWNGGVVVAGSFTTATNADASTVSASNIAFWNGTTWAAIGSGLGGSVSALAVHGGQLFAGGTLTGRLYRYDGSSWLQVGSLSNDVRALASDGTTLYVGGTFTSYLQRWDGSSFSAMPGGSPNNIVNDIRIHGRDLIVCGWFTSPGSYIARYHGETDAWSTLGSGLNYTAARVAQGSDPSEFYVMGTFSTAGSKPAAYFAKADLGSVIASIGDSNAAADSVPENSANGTTVGLTAIAIDADGDAVSYSLTDSAGGRFAIHGTTGVVTVAGSLDRESATSHSITVRASSGGYFVDQAFVIQVENVNETPSVPVDSDATATSVPENAANGTMVGLTASSSDPDGTAVSYSLSDDAGGRFAIHASSGVVTVLDGSLLDYETTTSHAITVVASDGSLSSSQTFSISLTNVDDHAPSAPTDGNAAANSVAENSANGTPVGVTAVSTDADGDAVTYSLTDSAGGRFAIHATTGVVTVADGTLLNYEGATSHSITVRATAGGQTADQTFIIQVTDVPEGGGVVATANIRIGGIMPAQIDRVVIRREGQVDITATLGARQWIATIPAQDDILVIEYIFRNGDRTSATFSAQVVP